MDGSKTKISTSTLRASFGIVWVAMPDHEVEE